MASVPVVPEVKTKLRREYQLTDEEGKPIGPPQVFEAETAEELLDKIQTAHIHASRAIHRMRQSSKPDLEALKPTPTSSWTADEAFQLAQALQNPEKAVKVLDDFVERKVKPLREDAQLAASRAVSETFMDSHDNYIPCEHNQKLLMEFLGYNLDGTPIQGKQQFAWTLKNLNEGYRFLEDQLTLKTKPEVPKTPDPAPNGEITPPKTEEITSTPAVRPRGATSTGLMSRHGSSAAEPPRKSADESFAEEVKKLSRDELRRRIEHDAKFRERLNNLGKK